MTTRGLTDVFRLLRCKLREIPGTGKNSALVEQEVELVQRFFCKLETRCHAQLNNVDEYLPR